MMGKAVITFLTESELESSYQFVMDNGWSHRIKGFDEWCKIIKNSQRVAVAMNNGNIVGFARGITDGLSNGYLSMVVVAHEYRKQGIGRAVGSQNSW
jgi:ribosomal protein S18 acetylase RimI-like enzyme